MENVDLYVRQPVPEQTIWRYMSLEKFLYLLQYQALFFPQAKHFEDPLEGFYSSLLDYPPDSDIYPMLRRFRQAPTGPTATCVISCWHLSEHESAAMWRLYTVAEGGIAIKSTVETLNQSLDLSPFREVISGVVNYSRASDPPPGPVGKPQIFDYFNKRESFSHECEYRILGIVNDIAQTNALGGVPVRVDPEGMISAVHVSPQAASWIPKLVEDLAHKTYSLNVPVVQSDLYRDSFP